MNEFIKQQQELAREMYAQSADSKTLGGLLDEVIQQIITNTRAEIIHEWNKAEQRLDGTAQGAVNTIEQFRNYITNLTGVE